MTVAELVSRARVLLQDTVAPYRYPDTDMLVALNDGLMEARRMRPDLFLYTPNDVPQYSAVDATEIDFDDQYRNALVYFVTGYIQLRDEEETSEARAGAFISSFTTKLTGGGG